MDTTPATGQQRRQPDFRHPAPQGADVPPQGGVHFRVWASKRHRVEVAFEGGLGRRSGASPVAVGLVEDLGAGTLYRYRLNGEAALSADPPRAFNPTACTAPHKSLIQAVSVVQPAAALCLTGSLDGRAARDAAAR